MTRLFLVLALVCMCAAAPSWAQAPYTSPYDLQFTLPLETLTADFSAPPRSDWRLQGEIPFSSWYSVSSYPPYPRHTNRAWGPAARVYPAPQTVPTVDPGTWQRERVLAVARKYIGYDYQHHHIPDFQPGPDWPWLKVKGPRGGKGIDCSDFTSFCYNYGLGWKLPTGIRQQAEMSTAGGRPVKRLALPASAPGAPCDYETMKQTLQTGDLLYIRSNKGKVSHVIMWVGAIGCSPDGIPLVIDSHGEGVIDSRGTRIPPGVHLRPFREKSWYHDSFDHALRLIES